MFMGSGNVILNINAKSNCYIGNDKNKLVPHIFATIRKLDEIYTIEEFDIILNRWNYFREKDNYYAFRDYWNEKYFADKFDKDFIYETVMLLKMCSNSMVRFNQQGVFNQGFRGLNSKQEVDGFFAESMKILCINGLNDIKNKLNNHPYLFYHGDFRDIKLPTSRNDILLIADPPYILRQDMYNQDFSAKHDDDLLGLLKNTKNDFIYFNYLSRGDEINIRLKEFIDSGSYKVIHINNKTSSGQGRTNTKEVEEVIVTNIV